MNIAFAFMLIGFLLAGCVTVPNEYPRNPSTALSDYTSTSLGQLFEATTAQHPGESGFAIIRHGRNAFTDRVTLTELAEKSLDLQYFIWEQDETGRILAERLIRAADRGVRVRVLVDDINMQGRDMQLTVEPGEFHAWIGGSSTTELRTEFRIVTSK